MTSRSSATEVFLNQLGYNAPYYGFEKNVVDELFSKVSDERIAVVHVTGGIDDNVASKVVKSLGNINGQNQVKCVILRIDSPGGTVTASEAILEECKNLDIPVICSFSNLAASGGYYISTCAKKIFTQRSTLTGSIGVFGIKLDASEAARRQGIEFDSVASGNHGMTNSLFHPLTRQMELNLSRNINRFYEYFKKIVSNGRNIPLTEIEAVAQGRVWTGEQAKEVGLVDEFGGLHKAISYAMENYTHSGIAEVDIYPKPLTFRKTLENNGFQSLSELGPLNDLTFFSNAIGFKASPSLECLIPTQLFLCMDEPSAVNIMTQQFLSCTVTGKQNK